ncbi:toprim domain-containing protein [Spirosoma arcticum]
MTKFDELKERFPNLIPVQELRSNVSIVELAVQYGYEPQVYKGRSRPVLEHPRYKDTIIIKNPQDPGQQVYQRAGDFTDAGTIIDFIRNRLATVFSTFNRPGESEFRNITSVLYDYLRIDPEHVNHNRKVTTRLAEPGVKQPFTKEQFDLRPLGDDNYLNQRNIAPQTLSGPEFVNKVVSQVTYFDPARGQTDNFPTVKEHPERNYLQYTNVAFPYFNGQSTEVTGLELRNENVKLHAPGSDRYSSVFVSNPPPKVERFFIMESAIDALSHRQLRSIEGDDKFNAVYFSTGGQLTPQQVNTMSRYMGSFAKAENYSINLAFDNDASGHRFDLQFIQQMMAVKFPMTPTVGGGNRMAYLLPEQEEYRPIRAAMLDRIELFNQNIQAQFVRSETDTLGQKELSSQLIQVSRSGQQVQISIPEMIAPLSVINKLLLEETGLSQRIKLEKACAKDFNQDLTREVQLGKRYAYGVKDETGLVIINGISPVSMVRVMQHLQHQAESEGLTKSFTLNQRQPYGFVRPHFELKIENGQTVKSTQTQELNGQVQEEKKALKLQQPDELRHIKQALNPENKPAIGQVAKQGHKKGQQLKPRQE